MLTKFAFRGLVALFAGALSCSSGDVVVIVNVSGQPADSQSLRVTTALNGTAAIGTEEFPGGTTRFGLSLPQGSSGELKLSLVAARADGCVVARAMSQAQIGDEKRVEVDVGLMALIAKECNGKVQPTLSVLKAGDGSGSVSSQPVGIDCGATCSAEFSENTTVSLTASAAMGSQFTGWSGACTGSDPGQCQVSVSGLVQVTANFTLSGGPGPGPTTPPAACAETNWCWSNPLPQGNLLRRVWGTSATNLWAVGDSGTILRYDGKVWAPIASGTTANLNYVWGVSDSDVWATGDAGTLLHWDGTKWSQLTLPSGFIQNLYGIWGNAANDVWFVHDSATATRSLLRWNGTQLSAPTNSPATNLRPLYGASANEVFTGGSSGYRYDGSNWVSSGSFNSLALNYLGFSRTKIYAVTNANVYQWDGAMWKTHTTGLSTQLRDIWGTSDTNLWASSDQGMLFYNGVAWSPATAAASYSNFGTGPNDIWSVGYGGTIQHWTGAPPWTDASPGPRIGLNAVWAANDKDIWTVGTSLTNTGAALHGDGKTWTAVDPKSTRPLYAVAGTSASDVWAVGANGTIVHYDGTAWATVASPTTSNLYGVYALSANRAWAIGDRVFLNWDGTRWASSSLSSAAYGLYGIDANNMWAAAYDPSFGYGLILKYNGSTWSTYKTYTSGSALYGIWGNGTDIWVVGSYGQVYRSTDNGVNFNQGYLPFDSTYTFRSVWGTGSKVWVFGERPGTNSGAIYRWDGISWAAPKIVSNRLLGAFGASGKAWAAGERGTILSYTP